MTESSLSEVRSAAARTHGSILVDSDLPERTRMLRVLSPAKTCKGDGRETDRVNNGKRFVQVYLESFGCNRLEMPGSFDQDNEYRPRYNEMPDLCQNT